MLRFYCLNSRLDNYFMAKTFLWTLDHHTNNLFKHPILDLFPFFCCYNELHSSGKASHNILEHGCEIFVYYWEDLGCRRCLSPCQRCLVGLRVRARKNTWVFHSSPGKTMSSWSLICAHEPCHAGTSLSFLVPMEVNSNATKERHHFIQLCASNYMNTVLREIAI